VTKSEIRRTTLPPGGDENVLVICCGNIAQLVDCWRNKDTKNTIGRFLNHFRPLGLRGYDIAADEGGTGM